MKTPRLLVVTGVLVALVACQPGSSGSAEPSASSAAADGEEVIGAFYELVTSEQFTADTEMSGVMSAGALQLSISVSGSIAGNDGSMRMKLNTVSDNIEFEVIYVGDFGYVRLPGGVWQRALRSEIDTSGTQLDSFEFLDSVDDLRYDGTTTHDGVEVHVLTNTRPLAMDPEAGATGEVTQLQILVLADGVPVLLSYHMTVLIGGPEGEKVAARGDIEQTFTDVGEPIVIEAPESFIE